MDEKMILDFYVNFCPDGEYAELLTYLTQKENDDEMYDSWSGIKGWLKDRGISEEAAIKWLELAIARQKDIEERWLKANTLLKECEEIAKEFKLVFSMPRVYGVTFGPNSYGDVGWNRSDFSC